MLICCLEPTIPVETVDGPVVSDYYVKQRNPDVNIDNAKFSTSSNRPCVEQTRPTRLIYPVENVGQEGIASKQKVVK
jgi:hypothetical protein